MFQVEMSSPVSVASGDMVGSPVVPIVPLIVPVGPPSPGSSVAGGPTASPSSPAQQQAPQPVTSIVCDSSSAGSLCQLQQVNGQLSANGHVTGLSGNGAAIRVPPEGMEDVPPPPPDLPPV